MALALIAAPVRAAADARAPNTMAKKLDKMGKKAYKSKDWDDAIAAFEAAYQADPLPRFLYNLGRCHEKKHSYSEAIEHLNRYIEAAPDADDRDETVAHIKLIEVKLKKNNGFVRIETKPVGALVQLKGSARKFEHLSPLSAWLPFGEYKLNVSMEGFDAIARKVVVQPKSPLMLHIEMKKPAPKVVPPKVVVKPKPKPKPKVKPKPKPVVKKPKPKPKPKPVVNKPAPKPPPPSGGSTMGWLPWATMGTGVVLLATGAAFGGMASTSVTERDDLLTQAQTPGSGVSFDDVDAKDADAKSQAGLATAMYIAGGVAAAGGVALLFVGGESAAAQPDPLAHTGGIAPTRGGAVLTFGGRY